jgi:hypothetical protein
MPALHWRSKNGAFVLPELIIVRLDVFAILDEVVQDPELAGLIDMSDSSILGSHSSDKGGT